MKKLILAGIVIIICCLVFLIVRQNSSQADIGRDIFNKPYSVTFGDWVYVNLSITLKQQHLPYYYVLVEQKIIEGKKLIESKMRFRIQVRYNPNTELGREWYREAVPIIKRHIEVSCRNWTMKGYPISLNDFDFDIQAMQ